MHIVDIKGNIPMISTKIKLFKTFFGKTLLNCESDVLKYSHSLIINAEVTK